MSLNEFRYILDESMRMLGRRKGSNAVSIIIMGLSLLILLVFVLGTLNIAAVIERTAKELRVYVYLADGTDENAVQDIQFRLLGIEGIEEVVYVPREEAMDEFRQTLGEASDLIDDLDDNPLPDAIRIKPKQRFITSGFLQRLGAVVSEWDGVEEVRYGKKWFERGEKIVNGFYMTDLGVGLIVLFSVIFVVSNTVRLTVLHRRRAIEVMKLIGATDGYIRTPFIVEGALLGAASSLFALGLLYCIFLFGKRYFSELVFLEGGAIGIFIGLCSVLGAVGSYVAVRRLLKI